MTKKNREIYDASMAFYKVFKPELDNDGRRTIEIYLKYHNSFISKIKLIFSPHYGPRYKNIREFARHFIRIMSNYYLPAI